MKRVLTLWAAGLLLLAGLQSRAAPPIPPAPARWVTDTAGFISESTRQTQDARLESFEKATGHQVLVWIGRTTGDDTVEDWTVRAFQAWRVGRKGLDDGVVLFIFAQDHTVRIEVGYGVEERVPDATASRIINEEIIPRIRAGDPDGAVTAGVDQLLAAIDPTYQTPPASPPVTVKPPGTWALILFGIGGILFLILLVRNPTLAFYLLSMLFSGRGRSGSGGGGFGGGGGFSGGGGRSGGGGATGRW